jgi:hypothetical protein
MAMDRRPLADRRRERTDIVEEAIISQRAAERRQRAWPDRPGPKLRNIGVAFELDVDPAPGLIGHLVRTRLLKIMIA